MKKILDYVAFLLTTQDTKVYSFYWVKNTNSWKFHEKC